MTQQGEPDSAAPAYGFTQTFPTLATRWIAFPRHYLLDASDGKFPA
jgi:hypothetical protein